MAFENTNQLRVCVSLLVLNLLSLEALKVLTPAGTRDIHVLHTILITWLELMPYLINSLNRFSWGTNCFLFAAISVKFVNFIKTN